MMRSYLAYNTVYANPSYKADGFVSVCKIRSDIKVDS